MKITALEPQAHHPGRWNLALDGNFAFGLDERLVVRERLSVGSELTEDDVARLREGDAEQRLLDTAVRFLTPRPRSRAEVRRRLLRPHPKRPTPSPEAVERLLDRLERLNLLSDQDFADFWVENRERFSPRSARALRQELRQHGVDRATAEGAVSTEQDDERALRAARQRARSLAGLDYADFRTRLGSFLMRRGFSYEVARTAVRALWEELHGEAAGDDPEERT
jgi:regulatory protein